ncbi:MAG: hypothetical protein WCS70_00450 [Verrucomicrobiota bacterium]
MDSAAWLGVTEGLGIGLIYGLWQAWDLRRGPSATPTLQRTLFAGARMLVLMSLLLVALKYGGADKIWLVVGVAVGFTAVFVWRMKTALAKKK